MIFAMYVNSTMTSIELLMNRAMELALNGAGSVSPNPLVGCVIVKDDVIIGEGWHQQYGGPHAEVNAITSVADKSKVHGSIVVVNLEPCSHHGKTPPCADLLIQNKVNKVIIANMDSNPVVSGKGIAKLRAAGVEVTTGVLEKEGRELNRRFFTMIEKGRPYIILKWAQTANGLIAGSLGDPRWISNTLSRQLVHKWRAEEDSVLVGYRTALNDDPKLSVRDWTGRNPVRLVIDKDLTLPGSLHLFDGSQLTIIFNKVRSEADQNVTLVKLDAEEFMKQMMRYLLDNRIQSIIVEGGLATLNLFIQSGLWDEARVFESPKAFSQGMLAPQLEGRVSAKSALLDDTLSIIQNSSSKLAAVSL
jgi:diaminohydroxyphosphoribosylaminopyrimidine deaminase / 5-amino-6-(5-phosphoribosylamino)uracil reductase